MIPVRIKMTNFLSYEDEEFDFSSITNATVVGANGAGKSSFCTDSITWALYGIGSKGAANDNINYVSTGADSCTVEFTSDLNGTLYKVIRSYNVRKAKNMVNLFAITADGDEVPISSGKTRDTQKYIEGLLRMNYKTFTTSSMICQNKASEFTEGMNDMERKEALINILDVDEWEKIKKIATKDISEISTAVALEENNASHFTEAIAKEKGIRERLAVLGKDLSALMLRKAEKTLEKENMQKEVFQMQSAQEELKKATDARDTLSAKIRKTDHEIADLRSRRETSQKAKEKHLEEIEKSQKLLDNKAKINQAVEEEQRLSEKINAIHKNKATILEKEAALTRVTQQGKDWNSEKEKTLALLKMKSETAKKQADALLEVPCAENAEYNVSCPFLKMANEAKQELESLSLQIVAKEKEQNPFRAEYAEKKKDLEEFSKSFDSSELPALEEKLQEVKKFSVWKAKLDSAVDIVNERVGLVQSLDVQMKADYERILLLSDEKTALMKERKTQEDLLFKLTENAKSFEVVQNRHTILKESLLAIEKEETALSSEIAVAKNELKQVGESKEKLEAVQKKIFALRERLKTATILQEACGKKSGVPALIIENAIPELESTANKVLGNLLEGRLQVRLITQAEKKSGGMADVLSITVLDNGYERKYETYSGAEKFVVDLSLRIAMSKFLAHRAGASVQLFVLDEGISCADSNNRNDIMDAIRSITGEFAKVFFITHIEELKDTLDQKIMVTKNSSGSHIKILN